MNYILGSVIQRSTFLLRRIYGQAYSEIIPLVIKAVWSGQESEETVADIFEKMLDFFGDEDFLLAFRLLCRTYYPKYKDMVTEYVGIYKELFDKSL